VVDVGHERHRRARHDAGEPLGRFDLVAGAADDVGPRCVEGVDLRQGAVDVGGLRDRHRLHGDRRATAHHHRVDGVGEGDLPGWPTIELGLDLHA
jgi:hypothetical protein